MLRRREFWEFCTVLMGLAEDPVTLRKAQDCVAEMPMAQARAFLAFRNWFSIETQATQDRRKRERALTAKTGQR